MIGLVLVALNQMITKYVNGTMIFVNASVLQYVTVMELVMLDVKTNLTSF